MSLLYVPFTVEAYVTNNKNYNEKEVAKVSPDYSNLSKWHLGGKLEPEPFENAAPLKSGVHLHFVLPDALTHATTDSDGNPHYPQVPNRWLVMRLLAKSDKIRVKSWMVESDYLGLDNKDSVTVPYFEDKNTPYRRLGRWYPLSESPAPATDIYENLTAVGPGDPTFAAYYPACRSVFGFHDTLEGVASGELSYIVVGYFKDKEKNPLFGLSDEEYLDYLYENKWSVKGEGETPTNMLFHGMVHTIPWEGNEADYPSNTPRGVINGAIGNSSSEALSALISNQLKKKGERKNELTFTPRNDDDSRTLERLLALSQYDLLDELNGVDGISATENLIHSEEFDSQAGGFVWNIRLKNRDGEGKNTLSDEVGTLLTRLNFDQSEMDAHERELESLREQLFHAWYFYVERSETPTPSFKPPKPTSEEINSEINRLCSAIDLLKNKISSENEEIAQVAVQVEEAMGISKEYYNLEKTVEKQFSLPKDPVLLLSGEGVRRPFAYGQDGRFEADGTLACRLQTIVTLSDEKRNRNLEKKEILSYCDSFEELHNNFSEILCEAVCLSPKFVEMIKKQLGVQQLNPVGQMPSPLAAYEWEQPWTTLFLDWKVNWFATRSVTQPDNSMEGWKFKDIDYSYEDKTTNNSSTYTGRTVLTPHSTTLFSAMMSKHINRAQFDEATYKKLTESLEAVKNLAVVSQKMGGLWRQLLALRETVQLPILNRPAYAELADKVRVHLDGAQFDAILLSSNFYPIRAGHLKLNSVNAINSFGIRQDVNIGLKHPIYSEQLVSENGESLGMLPPRFVQGARLRFEWISDRDNTIPSCPVPCTSPISGFLYPDLLNGHLYVYESDGSFKGTLRLVYREGRRECRWVSAPGEPTDLAFMQFNSEHLKNYIQSIMAYNDKNDPAFLALMCLIERRMDESCTYGESEDFFSLWSRPLVLSRARLSLELLGTPQISKKSDDFAMNQTYGFENVKIPIYLGDPASSSDGLIGFFPDGAGGFKTMRCAWDAEKLPVASDYLVYNKYMELTAADREAPCMSVLMEAGSQISIRSGILPAFQESLPAEHIQEVISKLKLTFEINPIISTLEEIKLPVSTSEGAEWAWGYRSDSSYVDMGIVTQPNNTISPVNPAAMDGILKIDSLK